MNTIIEYSPEETQILCEIYASVETIEAQAYKLPRRSINSIERKARALKLVKVRNLTMGCVDDLMSDGIARSAASIAEKTGFKIKYVREQLHVAADGERYHIASYDLRTRGALFKIGPGKNAVLPAPMHLPSKIYSQRLRESRGIPRRKPAAPKVPKSAARKPAERKPRTVARTSPAAWWPSADATVSNAMRAMVETARVLA